MSGRGRGGGGNQASAVLRRVYAGGNKGEATQLVVGNVKEQSAFTDNIFNPRSFYGENGMGSKDHRPIIPLPKTEAGATRIADSAQILVRSWGAEQRELQQQQQLQNAGSSVVGSSSSSSKAATSALSSLWHVSNGAHPDDPARSTGLAAVPRARFPPELSEVGRPLRRPKVKDPSGAEARTLLRGRSALAFAAAASSSSSSVSASMLAQRRRLRGETLDDDDDDDDDGTSNKKRKSSGAGGSGGAGDKSGKDGANGGAAGDDGAASVSSSDASDGATSSDEEELSNNVPSDDDDGMNVSDGDGDELTF
jgi:hypothetical protein